MSGMDGMNMINHNMMSVTSQTENATMSMMSMDHQHPPDMTHQHPAPPSTMNQHHPHQGHQGGGGHSTSFNFDMPIVLIFQQWVITDQRVLAAACVGIALLAVLFEIFKTLRQIWIDHLYQPEDPEDVPLRDILKMKPKGGDCCNDADDIIVTPQLKTDCKFWIAHVAQSVLYIVQVFIAFILMLIVMTYNVWLILSVCLGSGFGYLISGIIRIKMIKRTAKRRT